MDVQERIRLAHTSHGEELWNLVRDPHPAVISGVTLNRNLTEEMAVFIAKKKSSPAEALGLLANDIRFKDSYKLKVALCKNPKTPQKITFSLLKFLKIFDLGDMTRDQGIPVNIRQKIEYLISEKIPSMPSGNKIALSKRVNSNIVIALMERGDEKVISSCLESPALTEGHLCKIINKPATKAVLIKNIAEHPKWSLRYDIKFALIRNFHTSMVHAVRFIGEMKTADLRELYSDEGVPSSTKPYIYRELLERDETIEPEKEEIYELPDNEEAGAADTDNGT
ncbi:MAG: hypothetical protein AB1632_12110 [Nitrospirota bacterium]